MAPPKSRHQTNISLYAPHHRGVEDFFQEYYTVPAKRESPPNVAHYHENVKKNGEEYVSYVGIPMIKV
jgi:hypothetical protein